MNWLSLWVQHREKREAWPIMRTCVNICSNSCTAYSNGSCLQIFAVFLALRWYYHKQYFFYKCKKCKDHGWTLAPPLAPQPCCVANQEPGTVRYGRKLPNPYNFKCPKVSVEKYDEKKLFQIVLIVSSGLACGVPLWDARLNKFWFSRITAA